MKPKIRLGACLGIFIFCLGPLPVQASQTIENPEFYIAERLYRFDSVPEGAKVEHTFIINNRGRRFLLIKAVKPD